MHVTFMCDSQLAKGGEVVLVPCGGCCDHWYINQCSEDDDATEWKQTAKVPFLCVYFLCVGLKTSFNLFKEERTSCAA